MSAKRRKQPKPAPGRIKRRLARVAAVGGTFVIFLAVASLWQFNMRRVAPLREWRLIRVLPHDSGAFTQGLLFHAGEFYESTGLRGASRLRRVDPETGAVRQEVKLSDAYHAEGLALVDKRLYLLTWTSGVCRVHDLETFQVVEEFAYEGEGWGLTFDGERLLMTDGSASLVFRDPETFERTGSVTVRDGEREATALNELEMVGSEVWANVWRSNRIACIDPDSGRVRGWLDLSDLATRARRSGVKIDVLNGIAVSQTPGRVYVTGKHWPEIYEIEVEM